MTRTSEEECHDKLVPLAFAYGILELLGHRTVLLQRAMPIGLVGGVGFMLCALRDAGIGRWALPSLDRQTPRWFRHQFSPTWGSLLWGTDLGRGRTTRILFTGYYGLIVWIVLRANPAIGALLLAIYGFGRALPVLVAGIFARRRRLDELYAWSIFQQSLLLQLNAIALAVIGGCLLAMAVISYYG